MEEVKITLTKEQLASLPVNLTNFSEEDLIYHLLERVGNPVTGKEMTDEEEMDFYNRVRMILTYIG